MPTIAATLSDALKVRLKVLDLTEKTGRVPDADEVARTAGLSTEAVVDAFRELGDAQVYVLEPSDPTRLRMANPFSAVPTPFSVRVGDHEYFGNCVWDALGVISMLGGTGRLDTSCPDCRAPLSMQVKNRQLVHADGIVHFGVAARHWWDDIIHT